MRYVLARIEENNRDEAYRLFVTESLRLAPEHKALTISYPEFMDRLKNPPKEEKAEDIINDVMQKAGLRFE